MKVYLNKLKLIIGKDLKKIKFLVLATILIGFLDTLGIGLVGPYALLILDDNMYNVISSYIYRYSGINIGKSNLIIFASLFLISLFILKNMIAFFLQKKILKFSYSVLHELRKKIVKKFEYIGLLSLKKKKISNILQLANNHTVIFANMTLTPIIRICSEIMILSFIIIFLAYTNFYALMLIAIIFFVVTLVFFLVIKKNIDRSAKISAISSEKVIKSIIDFIYGFNEIRVFNKSKFFLKRFEKNSLDFTREGAYYSSVQLIPRYLLETSLIAYICLFILLGHFLNIAPSSLIYDISIFFAASIRVLPSLNQIIGNTNHIRYSRKHLNDLFNEISKDKDNFVKENLSITNNLLNDFSTLEFKNVSFKYNNDDKFVINNLSFVITKGQTIGISGRSGSGKTTLINLIMGLLKPTSGHILINGVNIIDIENEWHKRISYIPQNFYLFDSSIKDNVTLFENNNEIKTNKLDKAFTNSNIYDFIKSLPNKEDTEVGDNATKLSGGQKQRLAIARSLYFDRQVIIIDEGTSSLDLENEKYIISSLKSLKNKTKIIISHSLEYKDLFDNVINF